VDTPSTSRTSASLLARLRQEPGDPGAWGEFVDRYAPQIYAWCQRWRLQDADARDVTQNVLLKLAEKLRTFRYDPSGSFRAWLKTLTRRAWIDFVESKRRPGMGSGSSEVEELLHNVASGDDLATHLQQQFDLEVLDEARQRVQTRVDVQSWEAFRLAAQEELPGATVAQRLGMSVAAVYKAKSRVLKMLQDQVRLLEGEDAP
jgi:RNA polymerase sigma-70 factor (ECF subfamily)